MSDKKWTADEVEALKKLIRATVKDAGAADPSTLPHRVRERIKDRVTGDVDVDAYINEVLKEARR